MSHVFVYAGRHLLIALACLFWLAGIAGAKDMAPVREGHMEIAVFTADIMPPLGHPLCAGWYPPTRAITDKLSAIGIVVFGEEKPVVLCALDWAELSNRDHLRWREALAEAAGTTPERVAVQCTHAHDTPWPDRDAQNLLDAAGAPNVIMAGDWCERARGGVAAAVHASLAQRQPVTHLTVGQAKVDRVASNRRIMGDNGRVKAVRWTKTTNPAVRDAPEGVIDPFMKTISFWDGARKLAALHYYAVHPTNLDGQGLVSPEFVGLARNRRSAEEGVPHVYFTGCGGNITAGKYNDGNPLNRPVLAERIYTAMVASEAEARRVEPAHWSWRVEPVVLPPLESMTAETLDAIVRNAEASGQQRSRAAVALTYRNRQDLPIPISCLYLGADVCILNLPGEAFIEYQLYAQEQRPNAFVAVASYGDLGTGYITMERSFAEGGYEPSDSFVSGKSEAILREAIRKLMLAKP